VKLTRDEQRLIEESRKLADRGVLVPRQIEAFSKLYPRPRRTKRPDVEGRNLAEFFVTVAGHMSDTLHELQRRVPRGRRSVDSILEAICDHYKIVSPLQRNGAYHFAIHLEEHRRKAMPKLTLPQRAALIWLETDGSYGVAPDPTVARAFLVSTRQRLRYADARFRLIGEPDEVRTAKLGTKKLTTMFANANQDGQLAHIPHMTDELLRQILEAHSATRNGKK
jgi:hypothetical protein